MMHKLKITVLNIKTFGKKEREQLQITQTESAPAVLQAPITSSEIPLRRNLLKNKKAPFSDLFRNEMIKYSCNKMPHIYEKLFNLIFNSGHFPSI